MRNIIFLIFIAILLYIPANIYAQTEGEKINVCVECHQNLEDTLKDAVTNWQESVHKKAGVFCNDCHGGDPNDSGNAMDEKAGFFGISFGFGIPINPAFSSTAGVQMPPVMQWMRRLDLSVARSQRISRKSAA